MKDQLTSRSYKVTGNYEGKTADDRRKVRRHQLIETSIRLIGRQGYASVSLNAICAEAGLTKRYFYESFESVEDLLAQAFDEISGEITRAVIQQISSKKTPKDMITSGFQCFYEYIEAHPERGRVFLIEALSTPASRAGLLGGGGGDVSEFLRTVTRQFIKEVRLSDEIMTILSQGAVGAAIFVGQNWIASGCKQPIEELVEGVSEICFGISDRLNIPLDSGQ